MLGTKALERFTYYHDEEILADRIVQCKLKKSLLYYLTTQNIGRGISVSLSSAIFLEFRWWGYMHKPSLQGFEDWKDSFLTALSMLD